MARLAGAALAVVALAVAAAPATARAAPPGPPLGVSEERMAAALRCSGDLAGAGRAPVLLVHGTGSTVNESWRSGYLHALPAAGVPTCAVELPARSMEDIQIASEYVVFAIRRMAAASGRRIAVIGHSQGGLEPLWGLRFWPDLPELVDDFIALAAPFNGTQAANDRCERPCQPAAWQMRRGSRFLGALHRAPPPAGPAYTSLASRFDTLVTPQPEASRLAGARNIVLQDVCPDRPVDHVGFLYDNLTYQLVLDALAHPGAADPARLPAGVCQTVTLPFDPVTFPADSAAGIANTISAFFVHPSVAAEPALFCYADPSSPRGAGTYCPRAAPGTAPGRAGRPALRVVVSPRRVRARTRVRLRFRVTTRRRTAAGRLRTFAVRGARVTVAGRRARTDRRGRATLVVRMSRTGAHRVRATRRGYRPAGARVIAVPRRPPRPRFTG